MMSIALAPSEPLSDPAAVAASGIRLFVVSDLSEGIAVEVQAAQAHYLRNVMRLDAGDAVALFNGRDGEWTAVIEHASRNACTLRIGPRRREQAKEPGPLLAFAPLKKDPTDFLVIKATELGASTLQPVVTAHTAVSRFNSTRARAQTIEAAEQCGRLTVPDVAEPISLVALIENWPADRRLYLCDPRASQSLAASLFAAEEAATEPTPPGFIIGPEGGFATDELDDLDRLAFVTRVSLGRHRILRAETAAVVALACWQALVED